MASREQAGASTEAVVRRAVRSVIERTPGLDRQPALRRRLARRMVGVSLAAAELLDAERRLDAAIAERARSRALATAASRAPRDDSGPAAFAVAQSAGFGRAVHSAAGVLRATRDAIDFPTFVTSLITGVFQAMTTSTIQQLEAYANLLESVEGSASALAANGITPGRAATWAASRFPELEIVGDDEPRLRLREDADMPDEATLRAALDATADEAASIEEDDLETTLLPLVRRKIARDRQAMLATMVLMGMNRIVVDDGRIQASMELQVDARSTAEQTQASRFDSRFSTAASGSFGMGMWGASASMSASVGYVRSDEQYSREDIALRAGLRSRVDIGFHTEPIALERFARPGTVGTLRRRSRVPEQELAASSESLLGEQTRRTSRPDFGALPEMPVASDPASEEARALRERRDLGPPAREDAQAEPAQEEARTGAEP